MARKHFAKAAVFTAMVFVMAPLASADIIVDDFVADQETVAAASGPTVAFNTASSPPGNVLGGERDVRVEVEGGIGEISVGINIFGANLLSYNEDALTTGNARMTWDGPDGSEDLDATGLGGIDFTEGGVNDAIQFNGVTTDLPVDITLFAYTNAMDFSSFVVSLPAIVVVPQDFFIPFATFSVAGGSGADFTNIGAFRMAIDTVGAAAVDMTVDAIFITTPTNGVPEPGTLLLMGAGMLGLFGGYHYRRKQ